MFMFFNVVRELFLAQMLVVGSHWMLYRSDALSVICRENSCHVVALLPILFLG